MSHCMRILTSSLILTFVFTLPRAALSATSISTKHFGIEKNIGIEIENNRLWLLNGGNLESFAYGIENNEGPAQFSDSFPLMGTPLGYDIDRFNVYGVGDEGIAIISRQHQSRKPEYLLKDIGFSDKITGFSLGGSRLIVFNSSEISSYDPYAERWEPVEVVKLKEDEKIRNVVERYGLFIITTNHTVRMVSTTNDDYQNIDLPVLESHKDLIVNDFLITGKMAHLWLSAVKMVLQIDLEIDEENKKVTVVNSEHLTPFEEPNLSNIRRIMFWNDRLILVYDDGIYAYNPVSKQWNALIADPESTENLKPQFSFNGKINSIYKQSTRLLANTTNQGVLSVTFDGEKFHTNSITLGKSLPSTNVHDAMFDNAGNLLVQVGNGIFQCTENSDTCRVLREPSFVELSESEETKFVKSIARFGSDIVFLRRGECYRFNPEIEKMPTKVTTIEYSETNIPFDLLANDKRLIVVAPETVTVLSSDFRIIRQISLSDLKEGKHFDSLFSSAALSGDRLLLGLKKKFEQPVDFGEKPAEEVRKAREENPDNFIQNLGNAYLVDLASNEIQAFGREAGLYVKNVISALYFHGGLYVIGHDIKSGKRQIFTLDEKVGKWNRFAVDQTQSYRLTRISTDKTNILAYHENGVLVLSPKEDIVASLDVAQKSKHEDFPGILTRGDGFFNHERFGFYSGDGLIYFDREERRWSRLLGDTTYGFVLLGKNEIALLGPNGIRLLYPALLEENLKRQSDEKDFRLDLADLPTNHRHWSDRKIVSLAQLATKEDILFDIVVHFKSGTSVSDAEALIKQAGGEVVDRDKESLRFHITLNSGANLKDALDRISASPLTLLSTPNTLHNLKGKTQIVSDEVILTFRTDVSTQQIKALLEKYKLKLGPRIGQASFVVYAGDNENVVKLANRLQQEEIIRAAELNFLARTSSDGEETHVLPNDPLFGDQWALRQIGFDKVWNKPWPYQHDVVIAVIDSGVNASHPDLVGRVIDGPDLIDLDDQADDEYGHGTRLASIIAAGLDNEIGMSGLCASCRILRVRAANSEGLAAASDITEAIRWVVDDGRARVINVSLSGYAATQAMWDTVKYADSKGVLIVASAGNDALDIPTFPAAFPEVIAVSSTGADDGLFAESNYGSYVDISAPGENILMATLDGGYETMSGTSFSAAFVSGVIGAFLSRMNDASADQIKTLLYQTAVDIGEAGRDDYFGWGRLNAEQFLQEETLTAPLSEYYEDFDDTSISVYEEIPPDLDIFASDGFFKKLFGWVKKALNFVVDLVRNLVDAIVTAVKSFLQAVGEVFDFIYKKVLRPILRFFCNAACPIINFGNKAGEAFDISNLKAGASSSFFSVAGAFCAVGCPALTSVGIIQPYTRLVCEEEDPTYRENKHYVTLDKILYNETADGPFEVVLKTGETFEVESSVDLMQELHLRGAVDEDLEFDGLIFRKTGYEGSLLHGERRCWRVEYNPYAKITKVLDPINQALDIYNFGHNFKKNIDNMKKDFGAMTGEEYDIPIYDKAGEIIGYDHIDQWKGAKQFFDGLNYMSTYVPGDTGKELRETFSQAHSYFAELYDAREFIVDFDNKIDDIKQSIKNIEDVIGELPEDIEQIGEGVKQLITTDLTDLGDKIKNISIDLDDVKVDQALSDAASQTVYIKENRDDLPGDTLYQIASEIKNIYRNLYTICRYSNDDICEEIREFARSDFMKTITLGTALYEFLSYNKSLDMFAFQHGGYEGSFCGSSFKIPKGTDFMLGVNNILADDLLVEAWRKDTGDVVYSQHVEVPNPDPNNPLRPAEVRTGWNWRDSTGHLVKPGEYGVRAKYTDITGKQKVIDVLGENEIGYPVEPGELYNGVFDNEILGGGVAETTFHIDAGQEYLLFEFDFMNRRGAFSVISVELQIYDLNEQLVWKETRQMPVLGDEDTRGYDNTFVWNLKNINTGESVPDAEYTYRLVTTMQSGKQYINYFTRYVVRPTIEEPEEPEIEEPEPAVASVRVPHTGTDRYMSYQFDQDDVITGATDAFGNSYTFERNQEGHIIGAVYPGGSRVDYHQGGKMPSQITDRNGNITTYTYEMHGPDNKMSRILSVVDNFGNSFNFSYPETGKKIMTDEAGHSTIFELNEMDMPTKIIYPDNTTESFQYDHFGNMTLSSDSMGRVIRIEYNENNQPVMIEDARGNKTYYEYDAVYNLIKSVDPLGNETTMTYDERGNMLTYTDPSGRIYSYSYDSKNRRTSISDPAGNVTLYNFSPSVDTLTSVVFPDGSSIYFTYYSEGPKKNLIKSMKDGRGYTWQYEYDENRNLISITDPEGKTSDFTYNNRGQILTATNFGGRTETFEYDPSNGNLIKNIKSDGGEILYTYNSDNTLKSVINVDGHEFKFTYDNLGNVLTETDPLHNITSYSYYQDGNIKLMTNRRGYKTQFEYDNNKNLLKITGPLNDYVQYFYDAADRVVQYRNRLGKIWAYSYDNAGRLTSVTDPLNRTFTYQHDDSGNISKIRDGENNIHNYEYDSMGRLLSYTDPLGYNTDMTYDDNGNIISYKNQKEYSYNYQYDITNRLISEINPNQKTKLFTYYGDGTLESITDEKGQTIILTNDDAGRIASICNALMQCKYFSYDHRGNLITYTNRRGHVVNYEYDHNQNLVSKSWVGYYASFIYDENGNLLIASDDNGSISFIYDELDRITETTSSGNNMPTVTLTTEYFADDSIHRTTGPDGTIEYSYDDAGNLISMITLAGTFRYAYNGNDFPVEITYPNGISARITYNPTSLITSLVYKKDQSIIEHLEYEHDPNGNKTRISDSDGTHTYSYDELDQLIYADHPASQNLVNPDERYSYDAVGNRRTSHLSSVYEFNSANRLIEDDSNFYEYDEDGNLITKQDKDTKDITRYYYNPENRLIKVELPDGNELTFIYDVLGRLIRKTINDKIAIYVYRGNDIIAIYTNPSKILSTFVHGFGMDNIIAMRTFSNGAWQNYYYHKDAMGSVIALTDSTGNIANEYTYDSFGNVAYKNETVQNLFTYLCKELDDTISLYYFQHRYYNPQTGSFISEDTLWDMPPYIYVRNNPLLYYDPLGHFTVVHETKVGKVKKPTGWLFDPSMGDRAQIATGELHRQGYVNPKNPGQPVSTQWVKGKISKIGTQYDFAINFPFFEPSRDSVENKPRSAVGAVIKNGKEIGFNVRPKSGIENRGMLLYSKEKGFYVKQGTSRDITEDELRTILAGAGGLGYIDPHTFDNLDDCSKDAFYYNLTYNKKNPKNQNFGYNDALRVTKRAFAAVGKDGRMLIYADLHDRRPCQQYDDLIKLNNSLSDPLDIDKVVFFDGGGSLQIYNRGKEVRNTGRYPPVYLVIDEIVNNP